MSKLLHRLVGYPPFYEETNIALYQIIMKGQYEFNSPWWDKISAEAKDFVSKLLVVDHRRRMMCGTALKHPFITEHNGDLRDVIEEEEVKEETKTDERIINHHGHSSNSNSRSASPGRERANSGIAAVRVSSSRSPSGERTEFSTSNGGNGSIVIRRVSQHRERGASPVLSPISVESSTATATISGGNPHLAAVTE